DQLRAIGDAARGLVHAGQRLYLCQQRFGERRRQRAFFTSVFAADRALAGDHRVGVLVYAREHGRESRFDRVREDVGAAHHGHPQHDRDRRQDRPRLAPEQTFQGHTRHVVTFRVADVTLSSPYCSVLITSSTWLALASLSSLTISPSAR